MRINKLLHSKEKKYITIRNTLRILGAVSLITAIITVTELLINDILMDIKIYNTIPACLIGAMILGLACTAVFVMDYEIMFETY